MTADAKGRRPQILYLCECCARDSSERNCYEREEVRQMPFGEWWCELCHDACNDKTLPKWQTLPAPPDLVKALEEAKAILEREDPHYGNRADVALDVIDAALSQKDPINER